jgi:putative LysE/RhtB family amino acid efflux pump
MPIGPTAFLCFRRFVSGGAALAIATGLGTALGDTVYALVAAAGLRGVRGVIERNEAFWHVLASLVLIAVGILIAFHREHETSERALSSGDLRGAFLTTLSMALLNPATIAVVGGCIGSLGLYRTVATSSGVWPFIVGFLLGASCWWVVFAELTARLKNLLGIEMLTHFSRFSGAAITLLGIGLLVFPHL